MCGDWIIIFMDIFMNNFCYFIQTVFSIFMVFRINYFNFNGNPFNSNELNYDLVNGHVVQLKIFEDMRQMHERSLFEI